MLVIGKARQVMLDNEKAKSTKVSYKEEDVSSDKVSPAKQGQS